MTSSMKLPLVNFFKLAAEQGTRLDDLPKSDYIEFGSHVFVFDVEVNISSLLSRLQQDSYSRAQNGLVPLTHLHVYCHSLTAEVDSSDTLNLSARYYGAKFELIQIYAVTIPSFKYLSVKSCVDGPLELLLYYDVQSGPESFWLNDAQDPPAVHVLQEPQACLDRDVAPCRDSIHLDLSLSAVAGVRIRTAVVGGVGRLQNASLIASVPPAELEPIELIEFKTFGAHAPRLRNLPRLLDSLFIGAGEDLMKEKPDINGILAKLRFIKSCANDSPHFVGLVEESEKLLRRLQLPRAFPAQVVVTTQDTRLVTSDDLFFVPGQTPEAFRDGTGPTVDLLAKKDQQYKAQSQMDKLYELTRASTDSLMRMVQISVAGAVSVEARGIAKRDAWSKTVTVAQKMKDLQRYDSDLAVARSNFQAGLEDYKKRMRQKLWIEIASGVGEIVFHVGVAIYTGGAAAPLLVGDVNKILKGAALIKEETRLVRALKAVLQSLVKVAPKLLAACKVHSKESQIGVGSSTTEGFADKLGKDAAKITSSTLAGQAGDVIDHLGLLADWREMDTAADLAFALIREDIGKDKINGLDDYELATKNLAIRGETLIQALREAYDARRQYMMLEASQKAYEVAKADIEDARNQAKGARVTEAIAAMAIQNRLLTEIAQGRRVMFNLLHQAVLALIYQTNNVKLQKVEFGLLSPGMTATELEAQWAKFSQKVLDGMRQSQSRFITLSATDTLPNSWKSLMVDDLEVPFQISPQRASLQELHRLRIRSISVYFEGLQSKDGKVVDQTHLEYSIRLGPLMLDRASPSNDAHSRDAIIVQYYMPSILLLKQGARNDLIDDRHEFARRAVCCGGKVSFRKDVATGLDLASINDVRLNIEYEALVFNQ